MISVRDRQNIGRALQVAATSPYIKFRHGAVAALNKRPLATATNRLRNDPATMQDPPDAWRHCSIHAEVAVLRRAPQANTIYVARVDSSGDPCMAKPCPACVSTMEAHGVARVVYTSEDGIAELRLPLTQDAVNNSPRHR